MGSVLRFFLNPRLYISLMVLLLLGVIGLVTMDRVIMPLYTGQGQGITVPDVSRMPLHVATEKLELYGLRHELASKRSNEAFPAEYVIDQTPAAGVIVKPNRKVYITVNTTSTPTVSVPDITGLSLRNATIQLQNSGLITGNITYESSRFRNSILRQSVPAGRRVDHNTRVDLVVGDGLGSAMVAIPNLNQLHFTRAQNEINEAGLRVGSIRFEPTSQVPPNTVLRYSPSGPERVYEGTSVDLVVSVSPDQDEQTETGPIIIDETSNNNPEDEPAINE